MDDDERNIPRGIIEHRGLSYILSILIGFLIAKFLFGFWWLSIIGAIAVVAFRYYLNRSWFQTKNEKRKFIAIFTFFYLSIIVITYLIVSVFHT